MNDTDLQKLIQQKYAERQDMIEAMCEQMLIRDMGGVLVETWPDLRTEVSLSRDVPWGEVHYLDHDPIVRLP